MEFESKNTNFLFIVFAFIVVILYVLISDILFLKSYNIVNRITVNNKIASDKVILIAIDDKSLHEIGRWPWKREYYLEIFDYFENYTKAKVMGYDGLIMAPDVEHPQSDKRFFNSITNWKENKEIVKWLFSIGKNYKRYI